MLICKLRLEHKNKQTYDYRIDSEHQANDNMHSDVLKDDFPCNPLCLILVLLLHINPEGR